MMAAASGAIAVSMRRPSMPPSHGEQRPNGPPARMSSWRWQPIRRIRTTSRSRPAPKVPEIVVDNPSTAAHPPTPMALWTRSSVARAMWRRTRRTGRRPSSGSPSERCTSADALEPGGAPRISAFDHDDGCPSTRRSTRRDHRVDRDQRRWCRRSSSTAVDSSRSADADGVADAIERRARDGAGLGSAFCEQVIDLLRVRHQVGVLRATVGER